VLLLIPQPTVERHCLLLHGLSGCIDIRAFDPSPVALEHHLYAAPELLRAPEGVFSVVRH
jgi:hypothetical protein